MRLLPVYCSSQVLLLDVRPKNSVMAIDDFRRHIGMSVKLENVAGRGIRSCSLKIVFSTFINPNCLDTQTIPSSNRPTRLSSLL